MKNKRRTTLWDGRYTRHTPPRPTHLLACLSITPTQPTCTQPDTPYRNQPNTRHTYSLQNAAVSSCDTHIWLQIVQAPDCPYTTAALLLQRNAYVSPVGQHVATATLLCSTAERTTAASRPKLRHIGCMGCASPPAATPPTQRWGDKRQHQLLHCTGWALPWP